LPLTPRTVAAQDGDPYRFDLRLWRISPEEKDESVMSSVQHKLDRVRRPRVQITYDVETNGALQKVELPFVVGVLADLSGQPTEALRPLKERKLVNIDRDNFNDVLAKAAPRVAMKVQNRLTDEDTKLAVELKFKHIEDFEPAKVAEQVPALKRLLDMRLELTQLLSKMEGNDKLDQLLGEVLNNTEKAKALAKHMGVTDTEPGTEAAEAESSK
jgi:type VI secretion system protein ImpB